MPPRVTVIGLGPGERHHLTRQAWQVLQYTSTLYLRTERHPVIPHLPPHLELHAFDACYEQGQTFDQVYQAILSALLDAPQRPVIYGVPGHPLVAEVTTRLLLKELGPEQVRIVAGLSFLEPVCTALGIDPLEQGLQLIDALALAAPSTPFDPPLPLDPTRPALAAQLYDRAVAADLKLTLMEHYPDDHLVTVVRAAGVPAEEVRWSGPLHDLDHIDLLDHLCTLYLPPLPWREARRETDTLAWVCAQLRGPGGCPWDQEQDHASLRDNLLEESYEVLEALDQGDGARLQEELGDLLLQVFLHAQLGREAGTFTLADIVEGINAKLIRRHPHVFGPIQVAGSAEVCRNWEAIKAEERDRAGRGETSLLDGIPRTLPALAYAQAIGRRVSRVGFDWQQVEEVWAKVEEELAELRQAERVPDQEEELGDLLFALVNLARWLGIEAEDALRATNAKFRRRFTHLEAAAAKEGIPLEKMALEQMDALWEEAKTQQGCPPSARRNQ